MENNNTSFREPLNIDPRIVERLVGVSPPQSNWLSSEMFPEDNAFLVRGDDEEFLVAHPDFWRSVGDRAAKIGIVRSFSPIQVVVVDNQPGDTLAQTEAKRAVRMRFARAITEQLRRDGAMR